MEINPFLTQLEKTLKGSLPGAALQNEMSPMHRSDLVKNFKFQEEPRLSSVLILLFQKGNLLHIPVIKRVDYGGVHGGQISFPGGKQDPEDADLRSTAIRETMEEIGVDAREARFLGTLSDLYIPVSNFSVRPFVAFIDNTELAYKPDPREVDQVFEIKLQEYLAGQNRSKGRIISNRGYQIDAPYFALEGQKLWGASAMIFGEFLGIIDKFHDSSL